MKFWPFPLIRNHRTNKDLSALFLLFAGSNNLEVVQTEYGETTVTCEHGDLCFWSNNAYYAWGQRGWYESVGEKRVEWEGELPSRYAVRAMAKAINFKPRVKQKFKLEGV